MNLQALIDNGRLKEFPGVSVNQVKKRFKRALSYYGFAKKNFDFNDEQYNLNIYTNIYQATRITGEAFLLLNNYRATGRDHHKTVMDAIKLILKNNNEDKKIDDNILRELNKMRKNRNIIDYDDVEKLDISRQKLEYSIRVVFKFMAKVREIIEKKDKQQKLM